MALIYGDSEGKGGGWSGVPIHEWGTSRVMGAWRKHAENREMLELYAKWGSWQEMARAEKELVTCAKKMKWWERHRAFDAEKAREILIELARTWKGAGPRRK